MKLYATPCLPMTSISAGEAFAKAGIDKVEQHCAEWLSNARAHAKLMCWFGDVVTTDDLRTEPITSPPSEHAWGAIFRHKDFIWTGQWKKSEIISNHGRWIRVWKLNDLANR